MSFWSWLAGPNSLLGKLFGEKKPAPVTPPTPVILTTTVGVSVWSPNGVGIANATGSLVPWDGTPAVIGTNANGRFTFVTTSTGGSTLVFGAPGYVSQNISFTIAASGPDVTLQPVSQRPAIVVQPAIAPPFDANDAGGAVSTSLPPEQVIPPSPTMGWWRGDIAGVMVPNPPPTLVPGGNSTPNNMIMSFQLPYYIQPQYGGMAYVDAILTAHAQRGYTHFHMDQATWQAAGMSVANMVSFFRYVQSWGFYTSYWALDSSALAVPNLAAAQPIIDPFLTALIAGSDPTKSVMVVGEELNSYTTPGSPGLDDIINHVCSLCNPVGMPVGLHFTSDYPSWQASGTPDQWWSGWVGKVEFELWQGSWTDPAGTMAAHLWDTRRYCDTADGSSGAIKVVAFELMATAELYGQCTEQQCQLRSWEMICALRGAPNPNCQPVSGFGNGCVYPNGTII